MCCHAEQLALATDHSAKEEATDNVLQGSLKQHVVPVNAEVCRPHTQINLSRGRVIDAVNHQAQQVAAVNVEVAHC
jgi:hypothetical protein